MGDVECEKPQEKDTEKKENIDSSSLTIVDDEVNQRVVANTLNDQHQIGFIESVQKKTRNIEVTVALAFGENTISQDFSPKYLEKSESYHTNIGVLYEYVDGEPETPDDLLGKELPVKRFKDSWSIDILKVRGKRDEPSKMKYGVRLFIHRLLTPLVALLFGFMVAAITKSSIAVAVFLLALIFVVPLLGYADGGRIRNADYQWIRKIYD